MTVRYSLTASLVSLVLCCGCGSETGGASDGNSGGGGDGPGAAAPTDVSGLESDVAMISAGLAFSCAVTTAGELKCWGWNSEGQLGRETTEDHSAVPLDVTGLSSGVATVSAGTHACAVTTSGGVKCWGRNTRGQLGDGTTTDSPVPVDVVGLSSGVVSVSAGVIHSCALTDAGAVKCWGSNEYGELGNGGTEDSAVPVDATELTDEVTSVSAGGGPLTCVVTTAGGVKCWGYNGSGGLLGNGSSDNSGTPVDVTGLTSDAATVSARSGGHTCALTTAGGAKCWGSNGFGGLGHGSVGSSSVPVDVTGLTMGAATVAAGSNYSCAATTSGGVKCWGANSSGELGDGTTTDSSVPVDVVGLDSDVATVSPGSSHTCALTASGGVKCWGSNGKGQLGN